MIALVAMSWPSAIVWVAVIICFIGVPIAVGGRRRGPSLEGKLLEELRAVRNELGELRSEVAELDRVLKSVE